MIQESGQLNRLNMESLSAESTPEHNNVAGGSTQIYTQLIVQNAEAPEHLTKDTDFLYNENPLRTQGKKERKRRRATHWQAQT